MNELKIFENTEFGKLGIMLIDGKEYFPAIKCAEMLGYASPRDAIQKRCELEGVANCDVLTNGGIQSVKFINEGNLYRLIINSKLPSAKKFEKWVFDEVLPSIRKTGNYSITDKPDSYTISDPEERAMRWIEEYRERKLLETKVETLTSKVSVQEQQISELTPKADYYNIVLNCKDLVSTTIIAKDYGKSAIWLNDKLHELGIQFKRGDVWLLYQKYAEEGYTNTRTIKLTDKNGTTHAKVHTYWTQKGRLFIYDLLKSIGELPNVEKA